MASVSKVTELTEMEKLFLVRQYVNDSVSAEKDTWRGFSNVLAIVEDKKELFRQIEEVLVKFLSSSPSCNKHIEKYGQSTAGMLQLAEKYEHLQNFKSAMHWYAVAQKSAKTNKNKEDEGHALYGMGCVCYNYDNEYNMPWNASLYFADAEKLGHVEAGKALVKLNDEQSRNP